MKRLFSEPLVQFLFLGVLLYAMVQLLAPHQLKGDTGQEIIVSQSNLLEYIQFQRKSFNFEKAQQLLASLSELDRENLVDSYVRDEALYREALALGLDDNDEIIRRRLIQKMEYVAQGFYSDIPAISEAELKQYFTDNIARYKVAASITFTHVFLGDAAQGENSRDAAVAMQKQLNANKVLFEQAGQYGDRFLFKRNYVERTQDYIRINFGADFADRVFMLRADDQWQGPLQSDYGHHLVLIKNIQDARVPEIAEVASIVLADAQRDQQQQLKTKAVNSLLEKYTISEQE